MSGGRRFHTDHRCVHPCARCLAEQAVTGLLIVRRASRLSRPDLIRFVGELLVELMDAREMVIDAHERGIRAGKAVDDLLTRITERTS